MRPLGPIIQDAAPDNASAQRVAPIPQESEAFGFKIPRPLLVLALLLAILVLLRLPSILFPREIDVDESLMLSQGMKLLVDPRPWKAADGTTIGPLNSLFLSVFLFVGFRPGYVLLHAVAALLAGLQLLLAHRTLLLLVSQKMAALGALLVALLYGIGGSLGYIHYSSEMLASVLLGTGFYVLIARLVTRMEKPHRTWPLFMLAVGLAIGSAPWAKLQALPIAAVLGVLLLAAIWRNYSFVILPGERVWETIALSVGVALPSAIILSVVVRTGATEDFWRSYILNNLAYGGSMSWTSTLQHGIYLSLHTPLNQLVMVGVVAMSLLIQGSSTNWFPISLLKQRSIVGSLLAYTAAAFFAASRPHNSFVHHGVFLVLPFTYIAVMLLSQRLDSPLQRSFSKWQKGLVVLALGATMAQYGLWGRRQVLWIISRAKSDSNEKIAAVIHDIRQTRSVGSLAIWGWAPGVYVLSGTPPATRDSITQYMISEGPFRQYFRKRFLSDLRDAKPDLFIDAVVPGAQRWETWTLNDGYESDEALRQFVQENYSLAARLRLVPHEPPVRFFVRNTTGAALQKEQVVGLYEPIR